MAGFFVRMKKNFKIVLYIKNLFTFVYAIMQNTTEVKNKKIYTY